MRDPYTDSILGIPVERKKFGTSETEIKQLVIAWIAIALAFTIVFMRNQILWGTINVSMLISISIISLVTVGAGFIFHELAHKFVAQSYGLWSEFRMDANMLGLSILMSAALGFVFAAPGAVQIFGYNITNEQNGRISVAGPLANIVLALLFASLMLSGIPFIITLGGYGFLINAFLALFNMLPFGILDGAKVLRWNPQVYGAVAVTAFMLVGAAYYLLLG